MQSQYIIEEQEKLEDYIGDMIRTIEMEGREINYDNLTARLDQYRAMLPSYKVDSHVFFNKIEQLIVQRYN